MLYKMIRLVIDILQINASFVNILLEGILKSACKAKFFNAGSGECFGDTSESPACENSEFMQLTGFHVGFVAWCKAIHVFPGFEVFGLDQMLILKKEMNQFCTQVHPIVVTSGGV